MWEYIVYMCVCVYIALVGIVSGSIDRGSALTSQPANPPCWLTSPSRHKVTTAAQAIVVVGGGDEYVMCSAGG